MPKKVRNINIVYNQEAQNPRQEKRRKTRHSVLTQIIQQKTISNREKIINSDRTEKIKRNEGAHRMGEDVIYDPDLIPSSYYYAEIHRKATSVGIEQKIEFDMEDTENSQIIRERVCQCCARRVQRQPIDLSCNLEEFAHLGPGYPLYFGFIKFSAILLIGIFISSGLYNLFTNYYYGTSCKRESEIEDFENECELNLITQFSLGNKANQVQLIIYQDYVNFGSVLIMIILFQYFRNFVKKIDIKYDILDINPLDYTLMMTNISTNYDAKNDDYDDDIQDYFERCVGNYDPLFHIADINLVYKMNDVNKLEKIKQQKIKEKSQIIKFQDKYGYFQPGKTISIINSEIIQYQKQIDDYLNKFYDGKGREFMSKYFSGIAFVSFQSASALNDILERFTGQNCFNGKRVLKYQGQKIKLSKAPDPLNVLWENLTIKTQFYREIVTYFITILFCFVAFCILYYYIQLYNKVIKNYDSSNNYLDSFIVLALSSTISLLINAFNIIIQVIGKQISKFEKQRSKTDYNISSIKKISLAQFIINALLIYLVILLLDKDNKTSQYGKTFKAQGLAYQQTVVIIGNTFIPFLFELTDIKLIPKKVKIFCAQRKHKKNLPILKTQQNLNLLLQKPDFNIINRYSLVLKNMYLVSFYSGILPIFLIIGLLSLLLTFFIDKYNLLRRRSVVTSMSTELAIEMTEMLEYCLILYTLGNLASSIYLVQTVDANTSYSNWSAFSVFLAILHAALPMQWVNERIFKLPENPPNTQTYEEAQDLFLTDYARENPGTGELSKQVHFQQISDKNKQKIQEQVKLKNKNQIDFHKLKLSKFAQNQNQQNNNQEQDQNDLNLNSSQSKNKNQIYNFNNKSDQIEEFVNSSNGGDLHSPGSLLSKDFTYDQISTQRQQRQRKNKQF